jgi:uncharacterized protein
MISAPRSSFSAAKRRHRLHWPQGQPLRILSIDGGGIKGIFPAALLSNWERRYVGGRSISECFDLITGTSTGGILALGLGAGKTAGEMLKMYLEEGESIFPPGWLWRILRRMRGSALYRYDRSALTTALKSALRDKTLSESSVRLCIPAFEGHHGEVYIFKTPHHPDYKIDGTEYLVKIGQATAAAPSYFRALDSGGYRFVDGGIWANNPIMIGITDALACYDIEPSQLEVLSIGCGRKPLRVGWAKAIGGFVSWSNVIVAAMDSQSQNAMGQARLIAGPENVVRIEPEVAAPIGLDDWQRASTELPPEADRAAMKHDGQIKRFFNAPRMRPKFYWPPKVEVPLLSSLGHMED